MPLGAPLNRLMASLPQLRKEATTAQERLGGGGGQLPSPFTSSGQRRMPKLDSRVQGCQAGGQSFLLSSHLLFP